jgi:arylsulfatase A-like enzyme
MILVSLLLAIAQGDLYVIVADDVGYQDLQDASVLGLTPNIDVLAAHGVTFTRAYANPVCSPSRRSLFFGLYAVGEAGSWCPGDGLTGKEPDLTLTSIAEMAPAVPSYLIGKWHLGGDPTGGNSPPYAHGFDGWKAGQPSNVSECIMFGIPSYTNWMRVDDGIAQVSSQYEPAATRDVALALPPGSGRLIVLAPQLAHGPFHRPPAEWLPPGYPPTPDKPTKYQAMIAALDSWVAQCLAGIDLDVDGVIFVGDNGTPIQVSPDPERSKTTTFERGIHVPLIVAGPGLSGGGCDRLSHIVDVLPTVALWFGVAPPPGIDGLQLFGVGHANVVCGTENDDLGHYDRCARGQRFKLRRTGPMAAPPLTEELFDLLLDPGETTNVMGLWPAQEAALRAALDEFEARP